MAEIGNIALAHRIAMALEAHAVDGTLSDERTMKLENDFQELSNRIAKVRPDTRTSQLTVIEELNKAQAAIVALTKERNQLMSQRDQLAKDRYAKLNAALDRAEAAEAECNRLLAERAQAQSDAK